MIYVQLRFYFSYWLGKLIVRLPADKKYSKIRIKYAMWSLQVIAKTLKWKLGRTA